jgi:cyclase
MMLLCYGGGVKTVENSEFFSLGIEKLHWVLPWQKPDLITQISDRVGAQSVIVVLMLKKEIIRGYEVYTHNV